MDNPRFVDEEPIRLVQDEDYDDYNTPRNHLQKLIPPKQHQPYN